MGLFDAMAGKCCLFIIYIADYMLLVRLLKKKCM